MLSNVQRVATRLGLPNEEVLSVYFDVLRKYSHKLTEQNPESYLYKILIRQCNRNTNRFRRRQVQPSTPLDPPVYDYSYAERDLLEACKTSIERVMVMRYVEGYTFSEVCHLCQVTPYTARLVLTRMKLL